MRILLAEDEQVLAKAIVKILEKHNYSADAVYNGADALSYLENGNYDAAILDIMMPILDGISVLKKVREKGISLPILILSAKSEIEDRVLGLDCGANDYLPKPFDSRELLARLRCMTRSKSEQSSKLAFGNVTLDRTTFELSTPTGSFRLAHKEFQMMEILPLFFYAKARTRSNLRRQVRLYDVEHGIRHLCFGTKRHLAFL